MINSPDNNTRAILITEHDNLYFSVLFHDDTIISKSNIGLLVDSIDFSSNVSIFDVTKSSFNDTWKAVNGKNKIVQNNYNEYLLNVAHPKAGNLSYQLLFRLYNDGFAYRYHVDSQFIKDSICVSKEVTKLNFNHDFKYWAYNGEYHNIGPIDRSEIHEDPILIPAVLKLKDDLYLGIHEAEIVRYAPFRLKAEENDYSLSFEVDKTIDTEPVKTSWRAFMVGKRPGDLVESNLLENLNEACKIEDTYWIKPGKVVWDWRVWGYKSDDGFEYGLNTVSHKRLIDFAAENNIQYLLIDADWYGPEFSPDSNPFSARENIDVEGDMAYAKNRGIGIILYLNDVGAKKYGLERVLKQFSEWGAVGVKYGFMRGSWENKVKHTREVVKLCAKYKLMVDFHDDPLPPNGETRTYPNLMAKEFCHAQADAKRSYFPETAVTSPFVNMIAGPIDYTNGWFDLNNADNRVRVFEEIPGTVAAEVAKLIVAYSGWMVLPDSPEEYLEKDSLFDCIRKMPPQFDCLKVLSGEIGEYISVARQAGNDWFIGSLTNRDARSITIDFSFLPKGIEYMATFYEDTPETHFLREKESYRVRKIKVSTGSETEILMAPGGGHSIYLKKL